MRLGAIFAGGMARRFGSDKAAALVHGTPMIERIATALAAQTDAVIVVGRDWPGLRRAEDLPRPGLGPLGALAGALGFAAAQGFAEVLTSGCDLPDLPAGLAARLTPAPAVVAGQPLVGLWPAELAEALCSYLLTEEDRSMRGWIGRSGARTVVFDQPLANINTTADLSAFLAATDEEAGNDPL